MIYYDGFNYPAGSALSGQNGGAGWGGGNVWYLCGNNGGLNVAGNGLSFTNNSLVVSNVGLSVASGSGGQRVFRRPGTYYGPPCNNGTYWLSFIAQEGNAHANGGYAGVSLFDDGTGCEEGTYEKLFVGKPGLNSQTTWGFQVDSGNSSTAAYSTGTNFDTTARFILVKLVVGSGTWNISMWVDPPLNVPENSLPAAAVSASWGNNNCVDRFRIQAGSGSSIVVDELRFGNSYFDVSPLNAPVVSVSPVAPAVCPDCSQTFTATVSGAGANPSYIWKTNGVTVSGITANNFTQTNNWSDGEIVSVAVTQDVVASGRPALTSVASVTVALTSKNPPNAPVVNWPMDGAAGVTNHAALSVRVSDPDTNNLAVTYYGRVARTNSPPDFTVIALPDTQFYSQSNPVVFKSQTDWILTNHTALNIAYVAQLGDCVQNGDNGGDDSEWRNATNALYSLENPLMTQLTNGIPYGVAVGNHDQSPNGVATGTTTFYNQYFGTNHFLPSNYYGGNYGTNGDNFYELFSAGGLDFIAVYFEYDLTLTSTNAPIFTWANNLLHTNANRRAIVVSHYLIDSYTVGSPFGVQGQAIYDALKGNPNLFLMLCGHVNPNGEGRRTDVYNGSAVQTLLSDYQDLANGGNGWLRIYPFSSTNNVIHAKTYSPWLDAYQTGTNSQFDVPYLMTATNPFAVIGTVTNVPSGGSASKAWFGLTTNTTYEWFVTVSDGRLTTAGTVARFTTAANFTGIPPTATITSPANNATFGARGTIALTATAADADGVVTNVAYYSGATKLADVTTNPYSFSWTVIPAGNYALAAVATDDEGLTATSSIVNVSVTNPPFVQILQQIKTVFVIAMENHNFKQPNPTSSPQQIFTNPAAPYLNSLFTPGHSNAAQVSYAAKYYNACVGGHPSEPNYIWAEAGTDFGIHTDNDPSAASANIFDAPHLTRQLNTAAIVWKIYLEDVQLSTSPTNSKSGTSGPINPYYGTGQYDYAVKHNPMAFFTDTQLQNVSALTNFLKDLTNGTIGRYNWITPNQFNDQHSALSGGYTYHSVAYTGDQAAIAQGDNFLSILIPKIMASTAYQDHGLIIIRWDESEGGDTTSYTVPAIILSPLAKGNAYASSVELNHSSVIKTTEEILGLAFLSNAIPVAETKASGSGYNDVATVNDLSDMFQTSPALAVLQAGTPLTDGASAPTFGAVNVGASVTNTFTVTNSGSATLIISNVVVTGANAGDFAVGAIALPASVAIDSSTTFKVVFAPTAGCARTATLQITNNDSARSPFTLVLTGTGNAAPVITSQPVSLTNYAGTSASFSVGATACAGWICQWYFGTNQLAGETNSSLNIQSVGPTNVGDYHAVTTSAGLSTNSSLATLTVLYQAPNAVSGQVSPGADSFQLTFSGPAGQTYQVLASDDLTVPASTWTPVGSGTFGGTNTFFTDADATNHIGRFYIIESP